MNIEEFCAEIVRLVPDTKEIWFHGSRATGTHHKNSDYDILVVVPRNIVGTDYLKIVKELELFNKQYKNFDIQPSHPSGNLYYNASSEGKLLFKTV